MAARHSASSQDCIAQPPHLCPSWTKYLKNPQALSKFNEYLCQHLCPTSWTWFGLSVRVKMSLVTNDVHVSVLRCNIPLQVKWTSFLAKFSSNLVS